VIEIEKFFMFHSEILQHGGSDLKFFLICEISEIDASREKHQSESGQQYVKYFHI